MSWLDEQDPALAEKARSRPVFQAPGFRPSAPEGEKTSGYFSVECPDGQAPVLRGYKSLRGMVSHLSKTLGTDTYVFPFQGVALPLRREGNRLWLVLPDNVAIRLEDEAVETKSIEKTSDAEGYVGPLSAAPPRAK